MCRHVTLHRVRSSFRRHRAQHLQQYEQDERLHHERRNAVALVKDRVRWMTAAPPPAPGAVYRPPPQLLSPAAYTPPSPLHITSDTVYVTEALRRRLAARWSAACDWLQLLRRVPLGHRPSWMAVLSFCYASPWLVSTVTRLRFLYRFQPHVAPPSALADFHPLHRHLITHGTDCDWVGRYRLMVRARVRHLPRAERLCYAQVMAKKQLVGGLFGTGRDRRQASPQPLQRDLIHGRRRTKDDRLGDKDDDEEDEAGTTQADSRHRPVVPLFTAERDAEDENNVL